MKRLQAVLDRHFERFEGERGKFFWRNSRLFTEFSRSLIKHSKAVDSANYRWNKERERANAERTQSERNANQNQNQNQNHIEPKIKSIVEKSTRRFLPPTLTEVSYYCTQRNSKVDPQKFLDYYESNGWRVGKNPMKSWQAAIRTWERNDYGGGNGLQNSSGGGRTKSRREQQNEKDRAEARRLIELRHPGVRISADIYPSGDDAAGPDVVDRKVIEGTCVEVKKT